jgi:hypothetical protein
MIKVIASPTYFYSIPKWSNPFPDPTQKGALRLPFLSDGIEVHFIYRSVLTNSAKPRVVYVTA